MNMRPVTIAAAVAIIVVGLAIGGWLALISRPTAHSATITTATTIRPPDNERSAVPIAAATQASTPKPVATPVPTPKPDLTQAPTSRPVATPLPAATVETAALSAVSPAVAVRPMPAGTWELDESNTQVGTIVWTADVTSTRGNSVVLTAHKQSVGGRPAVPCERQTSLRAEFSAATAAQSAPFREVNCDGVTTTGEIRVSIAGDGASLSGSFWRNGLKLGDFSARRR
jgi:hypothetical protein